MAGPPRSIAYAENGTGPAILYVPGSFSTGAAWRGVQSALPGYRHVATSLCGYGGTDDPRDHVAPGLEEQIDAVARTADRIGAPFHLVGHSFGGTVALCAAAAGAVTPLSLTTVEANPFALARATAPDLVSETRAMSDAFEAACDAGDPDAAGRIIDFWGGPGSWAALPGRARDYARETCFANVLDWRSAHALTLTADELSRLTLPTLLIRGSEAVPMMRATTDALSAAMPRARVEVIEGAGHFAIATHSTDCAALIRDHLDSFR